MFAQDVFTYVDKIIARFFLLFAPSAEKIERQNKRDLEAIVKSSFEDGTKLDRRIVAIENLIEKLEDEADRLTLLADDAALLHFRATQLLKGV